MKYMKELPPDAVRVKGALNWVTPEGHIYGVETRKSKSGRPCYAYGQYFRYHTTVNNHNGYVYAPIKYIVSAETGETKLVHRRLHIVIAETLIENPNSYPIVGHRNNIKTDNRAENLYWTTAKENTQKAVDDGLMVNTKGYEDSQSRPVIMFDTLTNKKLAEFGSMHEAERATGISPTAIANQAKYKRPVRRPHYFRFADDPSVQPPSVIVQRDMETDEEIARFLNSAQAWKATGVSTSAIMSRVANGKPKWTKSGTYFQRT